MVMREKKESRASFLGVAQSPKPRRRDNSIYSTVVSACKRRKHRGCRKFSGRVPKISAAADRRRESGVRRDQGAARRAARQTLDCLNPDTWARSLSSLLTGVLLPWKL